MRILVVCPYLPDPPHGGAPVRMRNFLLGLSDHGHEVTLVAGQLPSDPDTVPVFEEACRAVHLFDLDERGRFYAFKALADPFPYPGNRFATARYRDTLRSVLESGAFDLCWVNFLFMLRPFRDLDLDAPVVLDQHELQASVWRTYQEEGTSLEQVFAWVNRRKLQAWHPRLFGAADAVASVSPAETRATEQHVEPGVPVWTIPNGVDAERFQPPAPPSSDPPCVVFCAGMGVKRNALAARWFADEVFPRVREEIPEAEFLVVGRGPRPEVRSLAERPGISVTGTVDDVRPYYEQATACVVPQRHGAGTKVKVFEALAMGRPLVTTENGVRGIPISEGKHALVGDGPKELAASLVEVLQDTQRRTELARAGRRFVEERYTWDAIVEDTNERLETLVGG